MSYNEYEEYYGNNCGCTLEIPIILKQCFHFLKNHIYLLYLGVAPGDFRNHNNKSNHSTENFVHCFTTVATKIFFIKK
jgi:hypothetical protein